MNIRLRNRQLDTSRWQDQPGWAFPTGLLARARERQEGAYAAPSNRHTFVTHRLYAPGAAHLLWGAWTRPAATDAEDASTSCSTRYGSFSVLPLPVPDVRRAPGEDQGARSDQGAAPCRQWPAARTLRCSITATIASARSGATRSRTPLGTASAGLRAWAGFKAGEQRRAKPHVSGP
jgi:hypothetical protein